MDSQTRRLLDALRRRRIPFGIVTNGMSHKRRMIQALGLNRLTSCIYVSDVYGSDKPDDDIFRAAARCLRTRPQHVSASRSSR